MPFGLLVTCLNKCLKHLHVQVVSAPSISSLGCRFKSHLGQDIFQPCYFSFAISNINVSHCMTKPNKMTCAPSEDSDQSGHLSSLISVFAVCLKKPWVLSLLLSTSKDSDQTGWMHRLVCVYAGRTGHFVGFVMLCINACYKNKCWIAEIFYMTMSKSGISPFEPAPEIMALFVLRKLILQNACAAVQWGLWSDPLSTSVLHVCKQRRSPM